MYRNTAEKRYTTDLLYPKLRLEWLFYFTAVFEMSVTYHWFIYKLAGLLPEYPIVMEFHGVGRILGPQIMAEIEDVLRYLL